MSQSRTKFYLDKQNKRITGVCAGVADYTGFDVTMVRVAAVVLAVITSGWLLIPYFAAAFLAPTKPFGLYGSAEDARFWQGVRSNARSSTGEVRAKFRDLDRRLADIESFYTSRNSQLASEIDSLR